MLEPFQPELLRADWARYVSDDARDELDRACLAKVAEWRWATGDMSRRDPLRRELHSDKSKWLKPGAKSTSAAHRHGLNADGSVHIVEEKGKTTTYVVYGSDHVDAEVSWRMEYCSEAGPRVNFV